MSKSKYVGLKINNVVVIQNDKRLFTVKCIECGIEKKVWINHIKDAKCNHKRRHVCINKVQTRCSGLNYTNSKEKLDFIKNKYRNGVTRDILNEILAR